MKNSLDIIIATTILVIALIVSGASWSAKRTVTKPAEPKQPTVTLVKLPDLKPAMENGMSLAGSTSRTSGTGGASGVYSGGPPPGMMMGGMPGMPGGVGMPVGRPGGPGGPGGPGAAISGRVGGGRD